MNSSFDPNGNNLNNNTQNPEGGSQASGTGPVNQGSQEQNGWSPYHGQGDPGRQEFFQRYNTLFNESNGSYQGSYNQPSTPPYQPAPREKRRSSGKGKMAGILAACMVLSVAGGAVGGYGAARFLGGSTVFYQSVPNNTISGDPTAAGSGGGTLSVAQIAAMTSPSVVEITTEVASTNPFFSQFVQEGAGSGVILSQDGTIVTNNHVIDGASKITVRTKDGTSYEATLVGTDAKTDIAVLKIDATGLQAAVMGDSDSLVVGEYAMAIGNPLGELGGTVTDGMISALSRDVTIKGETMTLLQTNAAINPGNSGGGLFNEKGELIGIVNAKSSGSESGTSIEGLGFAIPINTAKKSVEELMNYGYVRGRVSMGVQVVSITDLQSAFQYRVDRMGVYITAVTEGSGAQKAGVKVGDCILSIGDTVVNTYEDLKVQLNNHSVGDTVQLQVLRDGKTVNLSLVLGEYKPASSSSES